MFVISTRHTTPSTMELDILVEAARKFLCMQKRGLRRSGWALDATNSTSELASNPLLAPRTRLAFGFKGSSYPIDAANIRGRGYPTDPDASSCVVELGRGTKLVSFTSSLVLTVVLMRAIRAR